MSQVSPIVLRDITPRAPIFTTVAAATAAGVSPATASRALARLQERGLVTRLVRGLWADTRNPDFSPYAVVPFLLARSASSEGRPPIGYVSFLSALQLHGVCSQISPAIQIAVAQQHETVHTKIADFEFYQIQPELLDGYKPGDAYGRFEMATPAKALFDTLYLSARRGRRFSHLPELAIRGAITDAEMQRWIARIDYLSLRVAVTERWAAVRRRAPVDVRSRIMANDPDVWHRAIEYDMQRFCRARRQTQHVHPWLEFSYNPSLHAHLGHHE